MNRELAAYSTLVFDCDGVVLNSNRVKTQAFYQAALPYGEEAAQALVDYHVTHGGISRYKKFELFLAEMVGGSEGPGREELLESYAGQVRAGLLECEVAPGLEELRRNTSHARWLIVSGGDQNELREIFAARDLADLFDGGIFGSPDTKDEILAREQANGNITAPALFLGDSTYDHRASAAAGLDFVFLSGWTEVPGWNTWCEEEGLTHLSDLKAMMSSR